MEDKAEKLKSKHSSNVDHRLKKIPPDDASRKIQRYSTHNSAYVIETTYDSESSDQEEPEKKSRLPDELRQKSIASSNGDVRYPSIRPTSIEDHDNGNNEKPLPMPAEEESLPRTSRSRTPSPVKKIQSWTARPKAAKELRTTQIITGPTDDYSLNQDTARPNATTDSKPSTSNDSSRGLLEDRDRDRALPSNPAAGLKQEPAHIAARSSYKEKPRTRNPLPDVPRTEPRPSVAQKITSRVSQAIYGTPSINPDPRSYYNPERELKDLRTSLGNKEHQIKQSEGKIKELKDEVKNLQYSLAMAEEARDDMIRKQQEENFKQMDTGRWLPQEESKIKGDLDRLKRSMKSWSKDCSISSMTPVQNLMEGTDEEVALTQSLSNVVRLDDSRLPPGLTTSKTPSLLLNALLAHDVYKTMFENPFFFLRDQLDYEPPRLAPDEKLEVIYQSMLANGREAHIWRSQTLRLLYPPLRESSTSAEICLHSATEAQIAKLSEWHAARFVDGPAHHFIHSDPEGQFIQRAKTIYKQAAELSYQLWARRTAIKCRTLRDMDPNAIFALDSPYIEPHTLVRYDDHPDHLFGRPFTVVVHPIVEASGTDEGEGYDQKGRVWAKAVVWLDSRVDSRRP